ncbi:MAG: redoxin domain-containing protein, partial [Planctomycetota bacterium]
MVDRRFPFLLVLCLSAALMTVGCGGGPSGTRPEAEGGAAVAESIHEFTMKSIDGKDVPLASFKGQVVMIVNVASKCGFTGQYEGLQALYEEYKGQGFVILGFHRVDARPQYG